MLSDDQLTQLGPGGGPRGRYGDFGASPLALSGSQVTRLWPYGGPGGQYGSFAGKTAAPPAPEQEAVTGAGRARRRKRYYVEIDGEYFEVESVQEAQALLTKAKELAIEAAEKAAQTVLERRKPERKVRPVTLLPPKVTASPELQLDLAPLKSELAKVYSNAAALAELQLLLRMAMEEDDEEAILWLM